jgi:WD40 repeat protein
MRTKKEDTCTFRKKSRSEKNFANQWNPDKSLRKTIKIGEGIVSSIALHGRYLAAVSLTAKTWSEVSFATSIFVLYDLLGNSSVPIVSHGDRVFSVTFDPAGEKLVTGDLDGLVRVGSVQGDTPHKLIGHEGHIADVAVHPDGLWIASTEFSNSEVRLWKMPVGKPFHSLPYDEFLTRLKLLTNTRIVADKKSPAGYRIEYRRLSGW